MFFFIIKTKVGDIRLPVDSVWLEKNEKRNENKL